MDVMFAIADIQVSTRGSRTLSWGQALHPAGHVPRFALITKTSDKHNLEHLKLRAPPSDAYCETLIAINRSNKIVTIAIDRLEHVCNPVLSAVLEALHIRSHNRAELTVLEQLETPARFDPHIIVFRTMGRSSNSSCIVLSTLAQLNIEAHYSFSSGLDNRTRIPVLVKDDATHSLPPHTRPPTSRCYTS